MTTLLRVLIVAAMGWMTFQIVSVRRQVRSNPLGVAPIAGPAMLIAKVSAAIPFLLLLYGAVFSPPRLSLAWNALCICLLVGGTVIFTTAFLRLGTNLRMGLPEDETVLVTTGIYRFSRNPIYVGMYWLMGASLVYAFSWLNLIAVLVAAAIHHRIILAEERFLATRFKDFEAYRSRVRRYL